MANQKKKIKMEYYSVKSTDITKENPEESSFSLLRWLYEFKNKHYKKDSAIRPYYNEKSKLDYFYYDEKNSLYIFVFMRMRDENLPKRAYEDKETEDMKLEEDEYIGEEIIVIYDDNKKMLALQRNFHSLGVSGVEKYINETYNSDCLQKIHLRPILPKNDIIGRIKNKGNITKIEIGVNSFGDNISELFNYEAVKKSVKSFGEMGALCITIDISVGRMSRTKSLDKRQVNQLLDDIGRNMKHKQDGKKIIQKAHVSYKENEDAPIEHLDLIQDKLYDYIELETEPKRSIPRERIIDAMIDKFQEKFGVV